MSAKSITVVGKVPKLKDTDARRLSAYILRGKDVLARGPIQPDGSYRLNLSREAVGQKSAYGLALAVAPTSAGEHLEHLPNVPRTNLELDKLEKAEEFRAPEVALSEAILKIWWLWCRWYCVSGTVTGPDSCAAPGAEVTVYSVSFTGFGYSKVPQATVTTAPDGTFTACFEWCTCAFCFPCWPCWPIWWDCWPWWWELDMLHVIEAIERRPLIKGPGPVETTALQATLIRPEARQLARGQGFAGLRSETFAPDAKRTALIKSKLANPRIREIFPWRWWCCDNPNIVFSVTQNGKTILNEDPAFDTRWCFDDGSSVTLVGNAATSTVCTPPPPPKSGFVWTNVGNIDVSNINLGYAEIPAYAGTDYQDLAFFGTLYLYGQFGSPVSYYQVEAGQWSGNPARGGTAPAAGTALPIAAPLDHTVYIYNNDGTFNSSHVVRMGPFNQGGLVNLYAMPDARQNGPTPPGLSPFPAIPAGGSVYWDQQGLMLATGSSNLIGGAPIGAVDLTINGYDAGLAVVTLTPDDPLTLTIDNSPLTTAIVNSVKPFTSAHLPAPETGTGDCPASDVGPGGYVLIDVTVSDANGHLYAYRVDAEYGHGHTATVTPPGTRGYVSNPLVIGSDPNYAKRSWIGGEEVVTFPASSLGGATPPDCCYEFRIRAGKRVTNGYDYPGLSDYDFQTISLKFSS